MFIYVRCLFVLFASVISTSLREKKWYCIVGRWCGRRWKKKAQKFSALDFSHKFGSEKNIGWKKCSTPTSFNASNKVIHGLYVRRVYVMRVLARNFRFYTCMYWPGKSVSTPVCTGQEIMFSHLCVKSLSASVRIVHFRVCVYLPGNSLLSRPCALAR